ncbi:hypothetical protein H6G89_30245 [Oscillatoria sp. FACHB-1407]|uniref:hypothetical protein n=1 Tax=Oscillatoria sp. FACHB-1407 TaxID=2692847 RepID=UPI00168A2688|nr:hypothetical protein [Oscillatoria sp. FACHB-1407]MBD2465294.1 hypothetical protein [Oscillatoria sp. FACHB-1407]
MNDSTPTFIFTTIPPERVGLRGEYDYNGLAKRVRLALEHQFAPEQIENLQIGQRGAVVLLKGEVHNRHLLNELVTVAIKIDGAVGVEVNGVSIYEAPQSYTWQQDSDLEMFSSYAY